MVTHFKRWLGYQHINHQIYLKIIWMRCLSCSELSKRTITQTIYMHGYYKIIPCTITTAKPSEDPAELVATHLYRPASAAVTCRISKTPSRDWVAEGDKIPSILTHSMLKGPWPSGWHLSLTVCPALASTWAGEILKMGVTVKIHTMIMQIHLNLWGQILWVLKFC